MTAKEMLLDAEKIVNGDRQRDYGPPELNHSCTARLWTEYLSRRFDASHAFRIDARDICWLNILQKCSRDANRRKDDNIRDTVGYALNMAMMEEP